MRLFRRAHDTKTSVLRREAVSSGGQAAAMPAPVPVAPPSSRPVAREREATIQPEPVFDGSENSDVFLCKDTNRPKSVPTVREVTLFVHGWHNVEPGLLSWTFADLRSALDAVQRMKNAIAWCIVSGSGWSDLDAARAGGAVLVEQLA
jgi:hypothetical protein